MEKYGEECRENKQIKITYFGHQKITHTHKYIKSCLRILNKQQK